MIFLCRILSNLENNIQWRNNYKTKMGHEPHEWRYLSPVKLTKLAFKKIDNGLLGAVNARPRNDSRTEWCLYRSYLITIADINKKKD